MNDRPIKRALTKEPRVEIIDRKCLGFDVLRTNQPFVGEKLLAELKRVVADLRKSSTSQHISVKRAHGF